LWQVIGRLLDNPAGSALVFLAIGACIVAAGTYGVRAHRSWKGKNGNGHGEHTAELLKDFDGIGPPKPPRQRGKPFLIGQFLDQPPPSDEVALVKAAVKQLDNKVTGRGGLQERLAIVEQTCTRTEVDVKALPKTFSDLLAEQTVQLQEWNRKHILAAFEALEKQTDEKIAAALKGRS
jgi:hypothetical protein